MLRDGDSEVASQTVERPAERLLPAYCGDSESALPTAELMAELGEATSRALPACCEKYHLEIAPPVVELTTELAEATTCSSPAGQRPWSGGPSSHRR